MKALAVQKKLIEILDDPTVTLLVGDRVYDFPPEGVAFPFVTVGDISSLTMDTKTGDGMIHSVVINVWSKTSRAQVRQVMDHVYDLLHKQSFELDNGYTLHVYLDLEQTVVEPDKQTFRGIARYRVEAPAIS